MGNLDLNHRKEDRCDMKELWDMIYKTARRIALHQLEREIKSGLRPEIKNIYYTLQRSAGLEAGGLRDQGQNPQGLGRAALRG